MRLRRYADHWLLEGGPVPPGTHAITLGSLVILKRGVIGTPGAARLLRHEAEHVRQYREHGVVGFLLAYVGSYLGWRLRGFGHWAAYRRIPLEVEADWRARRAEVEP